VREGEEREKRKRERERGHKWRKRSASNGGAKTSTRQLAGAVGNKRMHGRKGRLRATGTSTQNQRAAGGQVALITKGVKFHVLCYVQCTGSEHPSSLARLVSLF
jgi:hypothetical protein